MAFVVIVIVAILGVLVVLLSVGFYRNYRKMLFTEINSILRFEKERTDKDIQRLEDNVRELALIGEVLFRAGRDNDFDELGRYAVVRNFRIDALAIGGGIWFEPHSVFPDRELVCFYAHNDGGRVRHDPHYETPQYHYPTQLWYTSIRRQVSQVGRAVAWTPPYFDDTGTMTLMTTAGCAIYDEGGGMVGMATVDWQLEAISASISQIRPTEGSFVLFADPDNDFVLANSDPHESGFRFGIPFSGVSWYRKGRPEMEEIEYRGRAYYSFTTTFDNGMILVANIPADELNRDINRGLAQLVTLLVGAGLLMTAAIYALLVRFINRPVAYLAEKAAEIGGGNLDTEILLGSGDELARLGDTLGSMALNLKKHIRDLKSVTAEKERIGAELDIAREIQASMLPSIFPPYPEREEFDIYASMLPAKEVGGDFYDFFMIGDDRVAVVIADVSGKGVPAALFMVIAKTLIQNHAQMGLPPAEVFNQVNVQLCQNNQVGMFVTAFMGILELGTGVMEYVNAGHNPPLLLTPETIDFLAVRPGFVLGGLEATRYLPGQVTLRCGDCLYLYTDGVTEAESEDGRGFGNAGLLECVGRWRKGERADMSGLLSSITRNVECFTIGAPQSDDITMLGLAYYGTGGATCGS